MVAIRVDAERIAEFCREWNVTELALFGSVLRPDFGPESDVDVMVTFDERVKRTLFDMAAMIRELDEIFDRRVDLVTRRSVENHWSEDFRHNILDHASLLYQADDDAAPS